MLATAAPTKLLQLGGVIAGQYSVVSPVHGDDSTIGEHLNESSSIRQLRPR